MKWIAIIALAALVISLGLVGYTIVQAERQMTYLQEEFKRQDKAIEAALLRQSETLRQEVAESLARVTPSSAERPSQTIPVVPSYQKPWAPSGSVLDLTQYGAQYDRQQELATREERERIYSMNRRVAELEEQARKLEMCRKFRIYC